MENISKIMNNYIFLLSVFEYDYFVDKIYTEMHILISQTKTLCLLS